jgi:hypothetical protein
MLVFFDDILMYNTT